MAENGLYVAYPPTLREHLIKVAVWVQRSARRVVLHLPRAFPWLGPWRQVARAVGASP